MSKSGASAKGAAFEALEAAVDQALNEVRSLREQLSTSQADNDKMQGMLQEFTKTEDAPLELVDKVGTLQSENEDFRARLEKARETVERLLAKIRFLEEQG